MGSRPRRPTTAGRAPHQAGGGTDLTVRRATQGSTRQVFTGEYRHSVDDKGRIAVPAKFRAQLAGGAVVSRWMDDCLAVHTREGWDDVAAKVAALSITDANARRFQRFLFANAFEADLDRQGRVVVPAYMREAVGLTGEAVVVGSRDHAEIWAADRWDAYRNELDDPDRLAEAISGLGI